MTPFPWAGSPYLAEGIKNLPCTTDIFHGTTLFLVHNPPRAVGAVGLLGVVAQFPAAPGHGSRSVYMLPTIAGMIRRKKMWLETVPKVHHPQDFAYYDEGGAFLDHLLGCLPHVLPSTPFLELVYASLSPHNQLAQRSRPTLRSLARRLKVNIPGQPP